MDAVDRFFGNWLDKPLDVDGFPREQKYQCYDVFIKYGSDVVGHGYITAAPVGGARDLFENFDGLGLNRWYEKIANDPNDPKQVPQKGDVMIWSSAVDPSGHVAIYDHLVDANTFVSFDQNWGGRYCHYVTHNWKNVLGWLRPLKFIAKTAPASPAAQPTKGGNTLMTPEFISNAYQMIQGRAPSQGEIDFHMAKSNPTSFINGFSGTEKWKALESQINQLVAANALITSNMDKQGEQLAALERERDGLRAEVDKLLGTKSTAATVKETRYVRLDKPIRVGTTQDPTNVYNISEMTPTVNGQVAKGFQFMAVGKAVHANGNTYFMSDGSFGAADATGTPKVPQGVVSSDLELVKAPATPTVDTATNPEGWKASFKINRAGKYVAVRDADVDDAEGKRESVTISKGDFVDVAGDFEKEGVRYYRSRTSATNGWWYGIPADALDLSDDDDAFDLDAYKAMQEALEGLAAVDKLTIRERAAIAIGRRDGALSGIVSAVVKSLKRKA